MEIINYMTIDKNKLFIIEESFKVVYSPIAKAIGECLITLENKSIDATAVISAIIAVAIDMADKANKLSKSELINVNHLSRFVALSIISTLSVSEEMKIALNKVAMVGLITSNISEKDKVN